MSFKTEVPEYVRLLSRNVGRIVSSNRSGIILAYVAYFLSDFLSFISCLVNSSQSIAISAAEAISIWLLSKNFRGRKKTREEHQPFGNRWNLPSLSFFAVCALYILVRLYPFLVQTVLENVRDHFTHTNFELITISVGFVTTSLGFVACSISIPYLTFSLYLSVERSQTALTSILLAVRTLGFRLWLIFGAISIIANSVFLIATMALLKFSTSKFVQIFEKSPVIVDWKQTPGFCEKSLYEHFLHPENLLSPFLVALATSAAFVLSAIIIVSLAQSIFEKSALKAEGVKGRDEKSE